VAKQPVCAVEFLARYAPGTRALVDKGATWLLFQLWPRVRVNTDTRLYLFEVSLLQSLYEAMRDPDAMAAYLWRWHPDFLLVRHWALSLDVYRWLFTNGWRFVHLDDQWAVMLPWRPETATLIAEQGYHHILPWLNVPVGSGTAPAVLVEAEHALAACPGGARFAFAYKAESLRLLGRTEESEVARRQVPAQLIID